MNRTLTTIVLDRTDDMFTNAAGKMHAGFTKASTTWTRRVSDLAVLQKAIASYVIIDVILDDVASRHAQLGMFAKNLRREVKLDLVSALDQTYEYGDVDSLDGIVASMLDIVQGAFHDIADDGMRRVAGRRAAFLADAFTAIMAEIARRKLAPLSVVGVGPQ